MAAAVCERAGDVEVVRERLGEVLPRVHRRVLRDEATGCQSAGAPELVVALQRVAVARALVAEELAAARPRRVVGQQHVLVVVADLVAEVAEHRPVRLAEPHAQRLAPVVEALGEVDA